MSQWVAHSSSESETRRLGSLLAAEATPGDVVLLNGTLGCGKTRFAQGAAAGLGILRPVTSPTFGLLNVYDDGRLPLYHFDLYRLETEEELESIDFFATVEGDGLSLVEWANRFPEAMPDDRLTLTFEREDSPLADDDAVGRTIRCEAQGPASEALLARWKARR